MRNIFRSNPAASPSNVNKDNAPQDPTKRKFIGDALRFVGAAIVFGSIPILLESCTKAQVEKKVAITPSLKSENFEITGITATGRTANGDVMAQMLLKIKATSEYKTLPMIAITTGGKRIVMETQGDSGAGGMALGGSRGTGRSGSGKTFIKNTDATPINIEIPKYLFAEGASEPVVVQVEVEFWKPGAGQLVSEKGTLELPLSFAPRS